jgi:hypothetical protein
MPDKHNQLCLPGFFAPTVDRVDPKPISYQSRCVAVCLALLALPASVNVRAATTYEPTLASLAQYQVPEWYQDAKFGIFIHYGLFSYPGQGCWFGNWM